MQLSVIEIILYVTDQQLSKNFYAAVLEREPFLDVPGMTEFLLNPGCKLGLMPENVIANILTDKTPDPAFGNGIPRCELYLYIDDPSVAYKKAVTAGAKAVSPVENRNWGDTVGYVADPDGHIIAFAAKSEN